MTDGLRLRLAETIAWCEAALALPRAVPSAPEPQLPDSLLGRWLARSSQPAYPSDKASLRTAALRPPAFADLAGYGLVGPLIDSPSLAAESVAFVCNQRRREIERLGIAVSPAAELPGGRILAVDFATDLCGAAVQPSSGFFDADDIPPWDTWFHHSAVGRHPGGTVYCWVPEVLVPCAEAGLDVIPVHSMTWIASLDAIPA